MHKLDVTAKDGTAISAVAYNVEKNDKKGVVIVSHGFGEHSGIYVDTAERLGQAGYACVLFDQRGHGAPPDDRKNWFGVIENYRHFLDDIASVTVAVRQMAPETPIALYGHSMGGNIVANALLRNDATAYSCAILEAPWLGLLKKYSSPATALAKLLGALSSKLTIVSKLSVNDLTGDPSKTEGYKADPLYHNRISFRMFAGINDGCAYAIDNAARLPVPVFLAYAGKDRIISNQATLDFAANAGDMVTVMEYDSCHAIHNDLKRDEYYRDAIAFLDKYCLV